MRTDSRVYSAEFVAKACEYIRKRFGGGGRYLRGPYWKSLGDIIKKRKKTQAPPPPTKPFVLQISLELYFPNLVIRENTGCIP